MVELTENEIELLIIRMEYDITHLKGIIKSYPDHLKLQMMAMNGINKRKEIINKLELFRTAQSN